MIPDAAPQTVLRNLHIPRFTLPFLLILVFLVYLPTLNNGFVWDDRSDIVGNPAIQSLAHPSELFASASNRFRPFVNVSFAVDYAIWGERAGGYHATNLLLHVVNVALFYSMTQWYFRRKGPAVLATLWFALFPLNAEAVHSISLGRSYLLAGTVSLFAIMLLIWTLKSNRVSIAGLSRVIVVVLLAAATSEWAVILPVVLVLVGIVTLRRRDENAEQLQHVRRNGSRQFRILAGFAGMVFLVGLLLIGIRVHWGLLEWGDLAVLSLPFVKSVQLLLFPFPVNLWYAAVPFGVERASAFFVWGGWAFIILVGCATWWMCRRQRREGWLVVVVLCMLVPIMARLVLFPNPPHPLAARWFYVPSMAWALLVAAIAVRLWTCFDRLGRVVLAVAVSGLLIVMSATVWERGLAWRNDRQLWLATAALTPDSSWAHLNLGVDYLRAQQYEAALKELQQALAIDPHYGKAYHNLGKAYERLGRTDEAMAAYHRTIEEIPGSLQPYLALANLYVGGELWPEAVRVLERALAIDPTIKEARLNLAVSYQELGEMERAIHIYREVIAGPGPPPTAYYNLALALAQTGRPVEAISMYEQFLTVAPPALSLYRQRAQQRIIELRER